LVAGGAGGRGWFITGSPPRGPARAAGIIKPFSHLTIVVRERAEAEDK
jgi:large subunit ribosomal protein L22